MNRSLTTLSAIGAVVAAMSLAACHPRDQAANESRDSPVAQSDSSTDRMRGEAREAAQDAKNAMSSAGEKVSDKVGDAVITTTVKAEIAKDSNLSAMKINVDTDSGRVQLRGTAPTEQAREHATSLASGVKGVVSVDNQLTVEPGKP